MEGPNQPGNRGQLSSSNSTAAPRTAEAERRELRKAEHGRAKAAGEKPGNTREHCQRAPEGVTGAAALKARRSGRTGPAGTEAPTI